MKKIIILGDYTDYPYHPFGGVDIAMQEIIGAEYSITCTGDYNVMADLSGCDLFISYTDCWKREGYITDAQAAGLISYVANGGKCLVVHSGLSLQRRAEFIPMMGGKFDRHPPMTEISVRVLDQTDPITQNVAPFTTKEEPYQYTFDAYSDITILSEYTLEGAVYPHSWKKQYCKGEVVYLMGGHTADIVREEGNAALLKNAVTYLLR